MAYSSEGTDFQVLQIHRLYHKYDSPVGSLS